MASSFMLMTRSAGASFNANNIMDDGVFDNVNTMNASQIDAWLNNNFGSSSCISTDHGFSAPQPIGYSPTGPTATGGFSYGGNVSAGTVIYDAAKVYGINPQVLLTTLEAQEGLLDGTGYYGCTPTAYTQAMGYDCPDGGSIYQYSGFELYAINGTPVTSTGSTGTCVDNAATAGFSRQVVVAAWQLSYDQQRSEGNVNWNVQVSNFPLSGDIWDNSDDPPSCYPYLMTQGTFERSTSSNYCPSSSTTPGNQAVYYSGNATIDGTNIYLDNGATAALYDYTPHFAGNENFDSLFEQYFGGIYASPYVAVYYNQSSYPQINQGQQATVFISYQNVGSMPWYDDNSLNSAPAGTDPVHLATANSLNRISEFSAGWPSPNRPDVNFSAVYLSDGLTLASNQNIVEPGQIAEFSFTVTDPTFLSAGTYQEYFQPIVEGTTDGLFPDTNTFLDITVNPATSVTLTSQSANPTLYDNVPSAAYVEYQNTGNVPLYDNISLPTAPAGTYPLHLATTNPLNSCSAFTGSDWSSCSRPSTNFAAVYESDGTTLASNQHVAQPGQIIKFIFSFLAPDQYASGSYQQEFQPILEGTSSGGISPSVSSYSLTVASSPSISYTDTPPSSVVANEPGQISINITNEGNTSLPSTSEVYTSNGGAFQASSWVSNTIIENLGVSLSPGQSINLTVPFLSPAIGGNYSIEISLVSSGSTTPLPGSISSFSEVVANVINQLTYISQSSYPTLTYDTQGLVYFEYQNSGNQPFYDNNSIGAATWRNPELVHMATENPLNRCSGFDDGWSSCSRPDVNFSAVYDSNGTTLAANQDIVMPGQIMKYTFLVQPEYWVQPNMYREYFQPVIEGSVYGGFNFIGTYMDINVQTPIYAAKYISESPYPTINTNGNTTIFFRFQNIGNLNWYDNNSVPVGRYPTHLATSNPINRISPFGGLWPSPNRPNLNFSKVYLSNGTTLAANQDIVTPGEIVEFDISLNANVGAGTYYEYYQPILEGAPGFDWNIGGIVWTKIVVQ